MDNNPQPNIEPQITPEPTQQPTPIPPTPETPPTAPFEPQKPVKKFKKKLIIFLIIIAVLLIGGGVAAAVLLTPKPVETKVSTKKESSEELSTETTVTNPEQATDATGSVICNDLMIGETENYSVNFTKTGGETGNDCSGTISVINKSSNATTNFPETISFMPNGITLERQDADYIVLDSGSSVTRSKFLLNISTSKMYDVGAIGVHGMNYWQDKYFFCMTDDTFRERPVQTGDSISIFYYDMLTNQQVKLISSEQFKDFYITGISGNILSYFEDNYNTAEGLANLQSTETAKEYDLTSL